MEPRKNWMWKRILLVFLFLMLISSACTFFSKEKIETAIGNKIQKDCAVGQVCSLEMNEVTAFEWDSMLVFSGGFTYVDINDVIGKDYFKESKFGLSNTLVFFKNGEIVYTEQNFRDIEGYHNGDTYFSDMDISKRYRMYPRNSVFEVKRNKITEGEYYSLQCKNCIE